MRALAAAASSDSFRAAKSSAAQARPIASDAPEAAVVNGNAAYRGCAESEASAHKLVNASERRDVQVQVRLGTRSRPTQTSETEVHATVAMQAAGEVLVASKVANVAAAQ